MQKKSYVRIFLDPIEVPVKIGIYDEEQDKHQRIIVEVSLFAENLNYLRSITSETIIDYSTFYSAIRKWESRPQVHLIEDYLNELADMCFENEPVAACRISIRKADVFATNQGAGIELETTREEWLNS